MEIDLEYEIIEYSNEGSGNIHRSFPTFEEALEWVNDAQSKADSLGNPKDICFDIIPVGKPVYSTISSVNAQSAAA